VLRQRARLGQQGRLADPRGAAHQGAAAAALRRPVQRVRQRRPLGVAFQQR
jgi:hypothetical protein